MTGATAPLWVGTASTAAYFDEGRCASYGVCDLAKRLTEAALPIRQTCNATPTSWRRTSRRPNSPPSAPIPG